MANTGQSVAGIAAEATGMVPSPTTIRAAMATMASARAGMPAPSQTVTRRVSSAPVRPPGTSSCRTTCRSREPQPTRWAPTRASRWSPVSVRNIQHEYWCGSSGCPGEPGVFWRPQFINVLATLSAPGATSTNWKTQFLIYDHEHSYRIVAWATDKDGIADSTRAAEGRN